METRLNGQYAFPQIHFELEAPTAIFTGSFKQFSTLSTVNLLLNRTKDETMCVFS